MARICPSMAAPMLFRVTGARRWSRVSRARSQKNSRGAFPAAGNQLLRYPPGYREKVPISSPMVRMCPSMAAPMLLRVTWALRCSRVSSARSRKKERCGFPFGG
jgi:hypothetical protein